jgi:hypothetical protein
MCVCVYVCVCFLESMSGFGMFHLSINKFFSTFVMGIVIYGNEISLIGNFVIFSSFFWKKKITHEKCSTKIIIHKINALQIPMTNN